MPPIEKLAPMYGESEVRAYFEELSKLVFDGGINEKRWGNAITGHSRRFITYYIGTSSVEYEIEPFRRHVLGADKARASQPRRFVIDLHAQFNEDVLQVTEAMAKQHQTLPGFSSGEIWVLQFGPFPEQKGAWPTRTIHRFRSTLNHRPDQLTADELAALGRECDSLSVRPKEPKPTPDVPGGEEARPPLPQPQPVPTEEPDKPSLGEDPPPDVKRRHKLLFYAAATLLPILALGFYTNGMLGRWVLHRCLASQDLFDHHPEEELLSWENWRLASRCRSLAKHRYLLPSPNWEQSPEHGRVADISRFLVAVLWDFFPEHWDIDSGPLIMLLAHIQLSELEITCVRFGKETWWLVDAPRCETILECSCSEPGNMTCQFLKFEEIVPTKFGHVVKLKTQLPAPCGAKGSPQ